MSNLKLGFLLSCLDHSDLVKSFVSQTNKLVAEHRNVDVIAFVNNQVRPAILPTFASMNINEAFDYKGAVVATTLDMAFKLVNFPGPYLRYYYVWDIDWYQGDWQFEALHSLFHDPSLLIVAKSNQDKKVIEQCWNNKVETVIPDCNVKMFVEEIRR